jgi:dUTP pyrophosphatase
MSIDIQLVDTSLKEFYDVKKNYNTDSGFDLYVPETIEIHPGETKIVDLKIKCKCYDGRNTYGYYMYPRSSISKTPLTMCNSVGIIDKDYRGNIMVALRYNLDNNILKEWTRLVYDYVYQTHEKAQTSHDFDNMFNIHYNQLPVYKLERGTRIVQLTIPSLSPFNVNFVDKLDDTSRGDGGFGSTGR